jgi:hypothetical protein
MSIEDTLETLWVLNTCAPNLPYIMNILDAMHASESCALSKTYFGAAIARWYEAQTCKDYFIECVLDNRCDPHIGGWIFTEYFLPDPRITFPNYTAYAAELLCKSKAMIARIRSIYGYKKTRDLIESTRRLFFDDTPDPYPGVVRMRISLMSSLKYHTGNS